MPRLRRQIVERIHGCTVETGLPAIGAIALPTRQLRASKRGDDQPLGIAGHHAGAGRPRSPARRMLLVLGDAGRHLAQVTSVITS